jgi:Ni,Fe-hydrogenase III large subunit
MGVIDIAIANLVPVEGARPWPRYEVSADVWQAIGSGLAAGEGDLLSLWGEPGSAHMAVRTATPFVVSLPIQNGAFPSIGALHAPALRLERTICDLFGFRAEGTPDERRWLDHGAWGIRAPLGDKSPADQADAAAYEFLPVKGEGLHLIPVGPVHAGIIEPGHFRFTANGEIVARLEQRLGYVHKGIDSLTADTELEKAARVVARVSGDSTVAASFAFARAVEAALGVEVPPRGQAIRGMMAELERIANHLGDIGAICNDASFSLLHAYCGIMREKVLATCYGVFAHRLMMDEVFPGGVYHDLTATGLRNFSVMLDEIVPMFDEVVAYYDETPSLLDRTRTTGIVSHDLVKRFAAGGHVGRASGRAFDARRDLAYPPYQGAPFDVPVLTAGDVDARVWIRIREVRESIKLLRAWILGLPDGPVLTLLPDVRETREGIGIAEAFRGDFFVWVRLVNGRVARCHVRDASWFQWPLLEAAIENNIVADFPLCNKSFNCSYSGHDI